MAPSKGRLTCVPPPFPFTVLLSAALLLILANCSRARAEEVVQIESSDEMQDDDSLYREFSAGKDEKGLFPSIFNLATHAEVRASATCGQHGPDYYCKLVEHVFLRQPQCDICDANNHHKNHPIDYAIDGTRRWWQSPSLSNGLSYEKVNITLDLRQVYQVAYVIIKASISPRPGTWVLEKSLDGLNFTAWQFFATSDSECMRVHGVPAHVGVPRFSRDDEVMCTSAYSKLNPLEYGEIHISLVNGRPGAEKSSHTLQEFTRARFVRLRLLGLKTLYADLMVINQRDSMLDHSVTRRYFYTISDISIGGQCICFGHAERCAPDVVHGQFRCECRHNTCGESCSECCPLFNQLPWHVGTHDHPNVCQPCQCFNHAHRCQFDPELERQRLSVTPEGVYEGGGRCMDCQHNTEGVNCEKCLPQFYRPSNVSHYRHDACRPCDCDLIGAESNVCIRDESEAVDGLRPGDCRCKSGFGGRRCDRCALGFRNHPICDPCPCDQAGSLNFDTCEEAHCLCKQNVEGEQCDRCRPGTVYLDRDNPVGCQPCFCFGKSAQCHEFFWSTGQISHSTGWTLTDLHGQQNVSQSESGADNEELLIFNAEDQDRRGLHLYYWKAPKPFLGDRLNSFGSSLYYFVYFVPREPAQGHPTPIADLVLEGNGLKLEFYSRLNFFPRENISVSIPLKPNENWYDARSRRPVDKATMMRVLADISEFWVRARYHQDQLQSSIYGLRLETAYDDPAAGGSGAPFGIDERQEQQQRRKMKMHPVEVCSCPEHFEGNSCERCEAGYRRVDNQLYDGTCKRCECRQHSDRCDPFSGHCLDCKHNTTGPRCELCLPGFYGNPSLGGLLGQCRPCACPTVVHSRSPECTLSQLVLDTAAAAGQDEYVCTACQTGYDGNKCEICADGFFGDPFAADPAQACRPCECNDNIDPAAIGNCDRSTGECLRCTGHTTGLRCELCLDNHWGSALRHSCRPCRCHSVGAVSLQCSNQTGVCQCQDGYTGDKCDRCQFGHGDVDNGCPECQCNSTGSMGVGCDEVSGQCVCKKGVYGKRCDMCVPSYYNFGPEGCQFCHCHELGAIEGKECHNVTGECQCQPHVQGLKCEHCASGFFNLSSGSGCQPCDCDGTGSLGEECDERTGQCRCRPGVAALKCDKCEPNHYGFGPDGCKQCQVCPAPGQVCDPSSGECVCPPNTEGQMCEGCAQNAWNYHPYRGCELCQCDGIGADSQICDSRTGQCKCKPGFVGHRCDLCEPGYYSFPECRPCECDLAGTEASECRGPVCLCSNQGQCKCKKHVTGPKCDQCAANAFSLESWNPLGCTECFCFQNAKECRQSQLVWRQIYSPDRRVVFESPFEMYERKHNLHVLREQPAQYNSYPTNHTPLYWPLPASFIKGDRTNSYNGFLRFRIRSDDNYRGRPNMQPDAHTFRLFPQVLLIGNSRIELEHLPERLGGEEGRYRVRLHESQWRSRVSPQLPLTRRQMMVALQDVQHVFIRASYNDMTRGDSIAISELSLDAAQNGTTGAGEPIALGVEECRDCKEGWTGLSCQNPAVGFFRFYDAERFNNPDDIVLIGISQPCQCHGHSSVCNPKTGECNDCQHNSDGLHCDRCRDGFYGNALSGSPDACHRCACPLTDHSFSATCRPSPASGRGYVCDACRPGYTGDYCDSCEPGYFGNPSLAGGFCAPCACHPHGSVHSVCHNVTGQCQCLDGVDGRDCSSCRPRHAFLNGVCTSCDRGCYRELMAMEDRMESALGPLQSALAQARPIPRKRLSRISASVSALDALLDGLESHQHHPPGELLWTEQSTAGAGTDTSRPLRQAHLLVQEFQLLQERNNDSLARLAEQHNQLRALRAQIQARNGQVVDVVNQLSQFTLRSSQSPAGQLNYLLSQAQSLVAATRERNTASEKKYNYAKKNAEDADALLKEIMANKLNRTSYEHLVQKQLEHQTWIRLFRNALWDEARAGSLAAKNVSQMAGAELRRLEKTIGEMEQLNREAEEQLEKGRKNVEGIKRSTEKIEEINKELADSLVPAARTQREDDLQFLDGQLDSLTELRQSVLVQAQKHATELEQQANTLKGRFAETEAFSMDALSASNAYKSIAAALRDATSAAAVAKRNAEEAFSVVDPESEGSLASQANASAARSVELEKKVESALQAIGMKEESARLESVLDQLGQRMRAAQKNISTVKDLQQLLEDHHDRINTVYTAVDEAHAGLGAIEESALEFNDAVAELKHRADQVQLFTSASIQEDIGNLSASTADLEDLEAVFEGLRERTDGLAAQFRGVRTDLRVLKEKIDEAREKAAKVRIGVRSEQGSNCTREFISPMRPSFANSIVLKYRPAMDSPDSLLFFSFVQGTRTQSREYLAVELRQKKIHVKWDIGGGRREAAIIKRNIVYIPASDRYSWYHIEVKRIANTVQASVVQRQFLGGEGSKDVDEPTEVVVGEPDVSSDVIFNTVPGQTRISLGLREPQLAEEIGLSTHLFLGTIGELTVDGLNVPLWVFASGTTEGGNCDGATGPPLKMARGHLFRNGFAQVRMPMAEQSNTMMLTVQFSAYSPNGLLYFRGSPSSGEFIALELDEGAVAVKADFGPEAKIALQSNGTKYADGRSHKVRVIRKEGEVHLQVDPEGDHVSIALADGQALLDIPEPDHFVAGVPPDFVRNRFTQHHDIHFDGFFGCVHSVRPNQVSELDLDNPQRAQRKEPGCQYSEERLSTGERLIGFQGAQGNFLKTAGILLDTDSALFFNFRTRNKNALLMHQSGQLQREEQLHRERRRRRRRKMVADIADSGNRLARAADGEEGSFLTISLLEGRLNVHMGTEPQQPLKRPLLSSSQSYNDGLLHSVFLSRAGKEVQVRVDDREVLATVLDDERPIGGHEWTMLLGGLPARLAGLAQREELDTAEPLEGCLSDFQLNYERLPILLEENHGITLGQCALEDGGGLPLNGGLETDREEMAAAKDMPLSQSGELLAEESTTRHFHRKKSHQSLEPELPSSPASSIARLTPSSSVADEPRQCGKEEDQQFASSAQSSLSPAQGVRFGVAESSHARINFPHKPYPDYANFSLSFEFSTEQPGGLLWAWASYRNYSRFFLLRLDQGFLQLEMKGHKQPKTLHSKAKRLDDGEWHKVEVEKRDREIRIQMDGEQPPEVLKDAPNPKVMRKRMYVGGVISKHRKVRELPHGFQGCIRHFRVNEAEQDLLAHSRDLVPCAKSPNKAYIHSGGFATFASIKAHQQKRSNSKEELDLGVHFRLVGENPVSSSSREGQHQAKKEDKGGRLLVALLWPASQERTRLALWVDGDSQLVLSIRLDRWRVHADWVLDHAAVGRGLPGRQQNSSSAALMPLVVCPGGWHRLRLNISPSAGLIVSLDDHKVNLSPRQQIPREAIEDLINLPVHLGGTTEPVSAELGVRSLLGCVSELELGGLPVQMASAKKLHKVIPNGCP